MKVRIISSVVAVIVLFAAMFMPIWGFLVGVISVAGMAVLEYFLSIKSKGYQFSISTVFISTIAAIPIWIAILYKPLHNTGISAESKVIIWVIVTIGLCGLTSILTNMKYNIIDVSVMVFGLLYVIIPLTLMVFIRGQYHGFYLIWLVFMGAWITDISAYFTGSFFGKRKIVPKISEKKTVEGFIGGIIGSALVMPVYGLWMQSKGVGIPWGYYIILGFATGLISQLGDWFASCIKRHLQIKDFGNIMPGHGGILDRFDSIFAVVPLVYVFILILS